MEKFIKENWFKAGLLIILSVVSFSLLYYFIYFLPQEEKVRLVQEQEKQTQSLISQCNNVAEKLYKNQYQIITAKAATSPEYKFILKDNKCYLIISMDPIILPKDIKDLFHYESIVDVYENKMILADTWFQGITSKQAQSLYGSKTYNEAKEKLFADSSN